MVTIAKKVFMEKVMILNSAIISEVHSRPSQMAKDVVTYLRKKLLSYMFDWVLNVPLYFEAFYVKIAA